MEEFNGGISKEQIYNENIHILVSEPPKKCWHFLNKK